jgi:hypothetical protein
LHIDEPVKEPEGLKYPLEQRIIDSRGKCPVYEEYKARMRRESMQVPELVKKTEAVSEQAGTMSDLYLS